ncbi:hypothetical protein QTP88_020469 [Uroleucon formosanum]
MKMLDFDMARNIKNQEYYTIYKKNTDVINKDSLSIEWLKMLYSSKALHMSFASGPEMGTTDPKTKSSTRSLSLLVKSPSLCHSCVMYRCFWSGCRSRRTVRIIKVSLTACSISIRSGLQ